MAFINVSIGRRIVKIHQETWEYWSEIKCHYF